MKRLILCILLLSSLLACKKNEQETELVGKYKLSEVLSDPGDGSGTFQPVNSNKTIEFFENSTIEAVGAVCSLNAEDETEVSGTYSLIDSVIHTTSCTTLGFELNCNELIICIPCIEPCKVKYIRE